MSGLVAQMMILVQPSHEIGSRAAPAIRTRLPACDPRSLSLHECREVNG